jgi:hypothetical protein
MPIVPIQRARPRAESLSFRKSLVLIVTSAQSLTALQRSGYVAIAPALFDRIEPGFESGYSPEEVQSARRFVANPPMQAWLPENTGPLVGLHASEEKLNAISGLNVLHLRAGYFMENNLAAIGMIQGMGLFGNALLPDVKVPMIATRDVGDYAAQHLLHLDFSGKQTREVLGERDLSMTEVTAVIARGIGKPDMRYQQFPYDVVQQAITDLGVPLAGAALYVEMYKAINEKVVVALEPGSPENTTSTSFEKFVQEVFVPAYHGKAHTA